MLAWLARRGSATTRLAACFSEWHLHQPAGSCGTHDNQQALALLPEHLPNLRTLTLIAPSCCLVAEQSLGCLQTLTALQRLDLVIVSDGTWHHTTLEWLQHLPELVSIDLDVRGMGHRPLLLPPSLETLTELTLLALKRASPEDDYHYSTNNIAETVSKLTGLVHLSFTNVIDQFPADLSGLTNLESFTLEGIDEVQWPSLANCAVSSQGCNQDTEGAMVTPAADWLRTCQALACLPRLSEICFDEVDLSDSYDHWALSNRLTSLSLVGCELSFLPGALVSLTALRELILAWNSFSELPTGPYLARLTELDLTGVPLLDFPKALCKALSLHVLGVPKMDMNAYGSALKAILPQACKLNDFND